MHSIYFLHFCCLNIHLRSWPHRSRWQTQPYSNTGTVTVQRCLAGLGRRCLWTENTFLIRYCVRNLVCRRHLRSPFLFFWFLFTFQYVLNLCRWGLVLLLFFRLRFLFCRHHLRREEPERPLGLNPGPASVSSVILDKSSFPTCFSLAKSQYSILLRWLWGIMKCIFKILTFQILYILKVWYCLVL